MPARRFAAITLAAIGMTLALAAGCGRTRARTDRGAFRPATPEHAATVPNAEWTSRQVARLDQAAIHALAERLLAGEEPYALPEDAREALAAQGFTYVLTPLRMYRIGSEIVCLAGIRLEWGSDETLNYIFEWTPPDTWRKLGIAREVLVSPQAILGPRIAMLDRETPRGPWRSATVLYRGAGTWRRRDYPCAPDAWGDPNATRVFAEDHLDALAFLEVDGFLNVLVAGRRDRLDSTFSNDPPVARQLRMLRNDGRTWRYAGSTTPPEAVTDLGFVRGGPDLLLAIGRGARTGRRIYATALDHGRWTGWRHRNADRPSGRWPAVTVQSTGLPEVLFVGPAGAVRIEFHSGGWSDALLIGEPTWDESCLRRDPDGRLHRFTPVGSGEDLARGKVLWAVLEDGRWGDETGLDLDIPRVDYDFLPLGRDEVAVLFPADEGVVLRHARRRPLEER